MVYFVTILGILLFLKIRNILKKESEDYKIRMYEKEMDELKEEIVKRSLKEGHRWSCKMGYAWSKMSCEFYVRQYILRMKDRVKKYGIISYPLRLVN